MRHHGSVESDVAAFALLSGAKQYRDAGDVLLGPCESRSGASDDICVMYFHAATLALKAFLAAQDTVTTDLRTEHDPEALLGEALQHGLQPDSSLWLDLHIVMHLLGCENQRATVQFSSNAPGARSEIEWSSRTVSALINLVGARLETGQHPIAINKSSAIWTQSYGDGYDKFPRLSVQA